MIIKFVAMINDTIPIINKIYLLILLSSLNKSLLSIIEETKEKLSIVDITIDNNPM